MILEQAGTISQLVPAFNDWLWVMAYPGIKVFTAAARAILPAQYRRQDCISHGRYLAGLIHAYHTQQPQLAPKLMQDVIAEPYRTRQMPGFAAACEAAKDIGSLACGISGSSPTLFSVCNDVTTGQQVADRLKNHHLQNDEGFVYICRLDTAGARMLG